MSIRYLFRSLTRHPVSTATSIAALTIGVGVSAVIFAILNVVLLEPLPYDEPRELTLVWGRGPLDVSNSLVSPANFHDWQQHNDVFESMGAYTDDFFNLERDIGAAERLSGISATAGFLRTLGVRPAAGRLLREEDEVPRDHSVHSVLISHRLWSRAFGARPDIAGQHITLSGRTAEVVGVLPPDVFFLDRRIDVVVPLYFDERQRNGRGSGWGYLTVVARLKQGTAFDRAQSQMAALAGRLAIDYPEDNEGRTVELRGLGDETLGSLRSTLLLLQGASILVLFIALANVVSLQLASALSRATEFATRAVLGGSAYRIARQVIAENVALGLVGGGAGVLVASLAMPIVRLQIPLDIPRIENAAINGHVLAASFVLAIVGSLLVGCVTAAVASRVPLRDSINDSGSRHSLSKKRRRTQEALVVVEVAIAFVLLVGTGLLAKSLLLLQAVEPGFTARAETVALDLSLPPRYASQERAEFFERVIDGVQRLPGVQSAGVTSHLPLSVEQGGRNYYLAGEPAPPTAEKPYAEFRSVSSDYLAAMGISLRAGRGFSEADMPGSSLGVVIINETLAKLHWGRAEDALTERLVIQAGAPVVREVIGVVGDVKHFGLDTEAQPQFYIPQADRPWPHMTLAVRGTGDSGALLAEKVRGVVETLDPNVPASNIRTMEDYLAVSVARRRFAVTLIGVFAATSLLLSAIGVFGVMGHAVRLRRREIGIRFAVGASRVNVRNLLVTSGLRIVGFGVATGLVGAISMTRLIGAMLFNVEALDVSVLVGSVSLLIVTALVACYLPARRASRLDPVMSLRT